MKKHAIILLFVLCTLFTGVVIAQQTPPDTSPLTRALADAQTAYKARTGHYAQVVFYPTPTPLPPALGDLLAWMPSAVTFASPLPTPPAEFDGVIIPEGLDVILNVYAAPTGDGYEIVYRDGGLERVEVAGPETWRAHDWRALWNLSPLVSPLEEP